MKKNVKQEIYDVGGKRLWGCFQRNLLFWIGIHWIV